MKGVSPQLLVFEFYYDTVSLAAVLEDISKILLHLLTSGDRFGRTRDYGRQFGTTDTQKADVGRRKLQPF